MRSPLEQVKEDLVELSQRQDVQPLDVLVAARTAIKEIANDRQNDALRFFASDGEWARVYIQGVLMVQALLEEGNESSAQTVAEHVIAQRNRCMKFMKEMAHFPQTHAPEGKELARAETLTTEETFALLLTRDKAVVQKIPKKALKKLLNCPNPEKRPFVAAYHLALSGEHTDLALPLLLSGVASHHSPTAQMCAEGIGILGPRVNTPEVYATLQQVVQNITRYQRETAPLYGTEKTLGAIESALRKIRGEAHEENP